MPQALASIGCSSILEVSLVTRLKMSWSGVRAIWKWTSINIFDHFIGEATRSIPDKRMVQGRFSKIIRRR